AAGQFYRQGISLEARVQPKIEGGLIVAMLIAIAAALLPAGARAAAVTAGACGVAGLLTAVRLARWRLWSIRERPDLPCLGAGYAWVAAGRLAPALALLFGAHLTTGLHVIPAGAIGPLPLNGMFLAWSMKARRYPARARLPIWGTVLIA